MKVYGGVYVYIHVFLNSVVVGEWSASCPCHFTSGKSALDTHWIEGWVGPEPSLDDSGEVKTVQFSDS
jgi:hypothetical protein